MVDMNNFYREFRKFRTRMLAKTVEVAVEEAKVEIKKFWDEQDWFVRVLLKKTVMKLLYKLVKKL